MKKLLLLAVMGMNLVMGNWFQDNRFYNNPYCHLQPIDEKIMYCFNLEKDGPGFYLPDDIMVYEDVLICNNEMHLIFMFEHHTPPGGFYLNRGVIQSKPFQDIRSTELNQRQASPQFSQTLRAATPFANLMFSKTCNSDHQRAARAYDLLPTSTDEQPSLIRGEIQEILNILSMPFFD